VAAAAWFSRAADQEHARAQGALGVCYIDGEGVEQNHALAATWLGKAANLGHAAAERYLATLAADTATAAAAATAE
jgi:hypothetical protein